MNSISLLDERNAVWSSEAWSKRNYPLTLPITKCHSSARQCSSRLCCPSECLSPGLRCEWLTAMEGSPRLPSQPDLPRSHHAWHPQVPLHPWFRHRAVRGRFGGFPPRRLLQWDRLQQQAYQTGAKSLCGGNVRLRMEWGLANRGHEPRPGETLGTGSSAIRLSRSYQQGWLLGTGAGWELRISGQPNHLLHQRCGPDALLCEQGAQRNISQPSAHKLALVGAFWHLWKYIGC